ncbi:MAG: hypothetical protein IKT14_03810 [Clostridiales bacterium]|nr:hypothetical protein [Clostridiales bacterium]MBR6484124.1 hypothetical protein [Clostridiales bacterium]
MDIQTSLREFVTTNADDVLRELFLCTGSLEAAETIFPEVFSAALKRGIRDKSGLLLMARRMGAGKITA